MGVSGPLKRGVVSEHPQVAFSGQFLPFDQVPRSEPARFPSSFAQGELCYGSHFSAVRHLTVDFSNLPGSDSCGPDKPTSGTDQLHNPP